MEALLNWYNQLDSVLQIYWSIAIFTSIVFAIQMVLTFVGLGDAHGGDADFGGMDGADMGGDMATDAHGDTMDTGGAIQLFTVRNVVNFLLGVGWGGVCFYTTISHPFVLFLVAMLVGVLFVAVFVMLYRQLMRLEKHGNFEYRQCVGLACDVYLRIPAERSGTGKVQISIHGSVHELDALTDGPQLASGTKVRVTNLVDGRTLLVAKI